jgi:hypothetical protein
MNERCARRNKAEQCVYHPAPLTKTSSIPTPPPTSSEHGSPKSNHARTGSHDRSEFATDCNATMSGTSVLRHSELTQPLPSLVHLLEHNAGSTTNLNEDLSRQNASSRVPRANSLPVQTGPPLQTNREGSRDPPLDYHFRDDVLIFDTRAAFTNDNAVLAENELSIGIQPPIAGSMPTRSVSQAHIERGATVLTLLRDFPAIQKYIDKWFSYAGGFVVIEPIVKIYTSGVWSAWQKTLESQKPTDLRHMSERIWGNTLKPLSRLFDRHTTTRDFYTSVTGEELRWEVVGVIVTLVSLLAQSLKGMHDLLLMVALPRLTYGSQMAILSSVG